MARGRRFMPGSSGSAMAQVDGSRRNAQGRRRANPVCTIPREYRAFCRPTVGKGVSQLPKTLDHARGFDRARTPPGNAAWPGTTRRRFASPDTAGVEPPLQTLGGATSGRRKGLRAVGP